MSRPRLAELAPSLVWQHPYQAHELAARGFDVNLTPGNAYYLDMAYSDDWDSTGGHWAGTVPLEKTYAFEPGLGWPADRLGHLLGVHACIWGNTCKTAAVSTTLFSRASMPLPKGPGSSRQTAIFRLFWPAFRPFQQDLTDQEWPTDGGRA